MITEKGGLLRKVRTVLTALVVLAGLGTTLMSMKPADKLDNNVYGVAETAGGWRIKAAITASSDFRCQASPSSTACLIQSETEYPMESVISKNPDLILEAGQFVPN